MVTSLSAVNRPVIYTKEKVLELAYESKRQGDRELIKANDLCSIIPDLGNRDHMKSLIAAAIASASPSNTKTKILTIGLSLIGSLAIEMYDNYVQLKRHLAMGTYFLEMAEFYNKLSLQAQPNIKYTNKSAHYLFNLIDDLTICEMMCELISFRACRETAISNIYDTKSLLIKEINNHNGIPSQVLYDRFYLLYENFSEIISDAEEYELIEDLYLIMNHAEASLTSALWEWWQESNYDEGLLLNGWLEEFEEEIY